ncbi:pyrroline-5-carboxylate reductase dimerization-domain-containing protein [Phaeosphaeriaceae sp. PMI808]|nr:pyrroline-5-carboxylate reductase dimerization-domain-containing protein [Phaeosphaeriaceae sp. PMI808]
MNTASLPIVQLTIIGCGTLGSAIVDGLNNQPSPTRNYRLSLTGRSNDRVTLLRKNYPAAVVSADNCDARVWAPVQAATAHLVLIGTQPEFTKAVCTEICDPIKEFCGKQPPVILTLCPGITTTQLQTWLPARSPIVRSMPNTPVAVGQGATALFGNEHVTDKLMEEIRLLLLSVSPCIEFLVHEDHLDVVASVSGSGPAYLFYIARAMVDAAIAKGLPEQQAKSLVIQSVMGAGLLAQRMPYSLSKLLDDVCVPGGSTEKAMATLDVHGTNDAILAAVHVSWQANIAMGKV